MIVLKRRQLLNHELVFPEMDSMQTIPVNHNNSVMRKLSLKYSLKNTKKNKIPY